MSDVSSRDEHFKHLLLFLQSSHMTVQVQLYVIPVVPMYAIAGTVGNCVPTDV